MKTASAAEAPSKGAGQARAGAAGVLREPLPRARPPRYRQAAPAPRAPPCRVAPPACPTTASDGARPAAGLRRRGSAGRPARAGPGGSGGPPSPASGGVARCRPGPAGRGEAGAAAAPGGPEGRGVSGRRRRGPGDALPPRQAGAARGLAFPPARRPPALLPRPKEASPAGRRRARAARAAPGPGGSAAAPGPRAGRPMHPPGAPLAMAEGAFSLSAPAARSPGGNPSRLHSIEAILGFPKEDGLLGPFPPDGGAGSAKEADKRGPRHGLPKMPGEPPPAERQGRAERFQGERGGRGAPGPGRAGGRLSPRPGAGPAGRPRCR